MNRPVPKRVAAHLDRPVHVSGPIRALSRMVGNFATFSGRASRSEFWWVQLAVLLLFVIPVLLCIIGGAVGSAWVEQKAKETEAGGEPAFMGPTFGDSPGMALVVIGVMLMVMLVIVLIVPSLSLQCRRLHDAGFSGLFLLLNLIPYLGPLVLLVFAFLPSAPEGARYDVPQRRAATQVAAGS
ncbi:DUF805 domain-containing protein [Brachybacterium subflavum]|uniref:DUF805 domain-containing protein n=1 Tax=Brachybacterium subflavum TaxID=2585206 RepID=UPI00126672BF|nr:DUF805 domain-containing protein [Brachybacterium subflavum]